MNEYKCIKRFANVEVGKIFVESNKTHPKWKGKMYFLKGGGENDWLLKNHIEEKEHFKLLKQ